MSVPPSGATLGATLRGVDLRSLADAQWRETEQAFHAHAVLVFPAQHLDAETQVAFARRFGRLERGMGYLGEQKATIYPISNVLPNGVQVVDRDHVAAQIPIGDQVWHTDSSCHRVPAKASVPSADVVPAEGGVEHPLFLRHPVTGRRSLFIGRHA